jgi:hypothetical protein
VLRQIAETLPDSPQALTAIRGIGKRSIKRYGAEILHVVSDYCRNNGIDAGAVRGPSQQPQAKADAQETDTRLISYRLYEEGLSIPEIASRRSLKPNTIAGHLAHYIGTGKLAITDFIDDEKIGRIAAALAETGADELGPAKRLLGDDCSYGELTMVRAHLAREP